jgi:glutamine amidotransferase
MIAIIKYNAGNTTSVKNALDRLHVESIVTDNEETLRRADKVIFPGVGEASSAMKYLSKKRIDKLIPTLTQPFLGICLGMQLMCTKSEEGGTSGFDIFSSQVRRFPPKDIVPHMGWNNLSKIRSKLCTSLGPQDDFYFVHSFYAEVSDDTDAICNYILPFSAIMSKDNFFGTQFHPEKSGDPGNTILKNFIAL